MRDTKTGHLTRPHTETAVGHYQIDAVLRDQMLGQLLLQFETPPDPGHIERHANIKNTTPAAQRRRNVRKRIERAGITELVFEQAHARAGLHQYHDAIAALDQRSNQNQATRGMTQPPVLDREKDMPWQVKLRRKLKSQKKPGR